MKKLDYFENVKSRVDEELLEDSKYDDERNFVQELEEFIVGNITWDGLSKTLKQYLQYEMRQNSVLDIIDIVRSLKKDFEDRLNGNALPANTRKFKEYRRDVANKYFDKVKDLLPEYYRLSASVNIAKDGYGYQTAKRGDRLEKMTEHNDGSDPNNEIQAAKTLTYFWNACNGYDFGLNINDYNFLKKYEHKSQKAQFNKMVNERLGKFDPYSLAA